MANTKNLMKPSFTAHIFLKSNFVVVNFPTLNLTHFSLLNILLQVCIGFGEVTTANFFDYGLRLCNVRLDIGDLYSLVDLLQHPINVHDGI